MEAVQEFVNNFTYLGILAVLLLGSLGVPIPEEMAIIEDTLALGVENACDGEPVHSRIPERKGEDPQR